MNDSTDDEKVAAQESETATAESGTTKKMAEAAEALAEEGMAALAEEANAEQAVAGEPSEEDPWAEAMAEQAESEAKGGDQESAKGSPEEDPWAAALAEQEESEASKVDPEDEPPPAKTAAAKAVKSDVFKPLEGDSPTTHARELDIIMNVPVRLNVELGRTRISIKQLLELTQGSVLELDGLAGDPMDILINGYLIAQGEVVVVEDKYGIRITDIITPSERVQKLNR